MRRYLGVIILAVVAIVMIFGGAIVSLYTDWLWFSSLGYEIVFSTILLSKVKVGVVFGVLFFILIYGNLWYARRIAPEPAQISLEQQILDRLGRLARRGIGLLILLGSVVLAGMVGLEGATHWEEYLMYMNGTPFGKTDPLFSLDIGFYVFQLPFINYIYSWLMFGLVTSLIASFALHYASETIEVFNNKLEFAPKVKGHLSVLVAAIFFLKAYGYKLSMYGLLFQEHSQFSGPGYTDVYARVPALWIMLGVAIFCGLLVLYNIRARGINLAIASLVILIGASILVGSAYPSIVQYTTVEPNEKEKEIPFIERAVSATNDAYGLTNITTKPFDAIPSLTAQQVEDNATTIENIRLWDQDHLKDAYNQVQTLQQYYEFADVDVDRYYLTDPDGENKRYRQVWLSTRELRQSQLPAKSQTWVNMHLAYTHGYGFCMSPVNEVSTEGLPEFFVKDIPPKVFTNIEVERPEVYFGELTDNYVFVDTTAKEFDYPTGDDSMLTNFSGESGVDVGSFFSKIMYALLYSDVNMLLNDNMTEDTRILYRRDVADRTAAVLPFLQADYDPYLVVADGKLYWMQDAYTTTDAYPYSQRIFWQNRPLNYIRNSIKIVTDAYTGDISVYIIDEPLDDPIVKTYAKMFPGLFKKIDEMPANLRDHIRYPEDMFTIQATIYERYHMSNPETFYQKSDLWQIPPIADLTESTESSNPMQPYYVIMRLPGGDKEEFILMTTYIRANKANMVAWMCARCDGDQYGNIVLYQFPKEKNIYGPKQIAARARQDTEISRQLSLWNQQGSQVSSGNLLVIPIENSLLYVMPVYLESTSTKIPELKRVVVALGDKVAMEQTLEEALGKVIGDRVSAARKISEVIDKDGETQPQEDTAPAPKAGSEEKIGELIRRAAGHFDRAESAQREGDWATYGDEMDKARDALGELEEMSE